MTFRHFDVGERQISLDRLVGLTSIDPARIFGLYPKRAASP
ncbi:MAG TPA: hypothetical protein VKY90_17780 [Candidatus Dormibacteraeota bacterium]|nr:hypothetical protein [Candidatus Dormibacteraeota bacterium]